MFRIQSKCTVSLFTRGTAALPTPLLQPCCFYSFKRPDALPKRPPSAFTQFALDQTKPGMRIEMAQCAEQWKKSPSKNRYMTDYKEKLDAYNQEIKELKAQPEVWKEIQQYRKDRREQLAEVRETKAKKKLEREHNKPKVIGNGYSLYVQERISQMMGSSTEKLSQLAKDWNKLGAAEKQIYNDRSAELREAQEPKLIEWEREMYDLGHAHLVRNTTLRIIKREQKLHQKQ